VTAFCMAVMRPDSTQTLVLWNEGPHRAGIWHSCIRLLDNGTVLMTTPVLVEGPPGGEGGVTWPLHVHLQVRYNFAPLQSETKGKRAMFSQIPRKWKHLHMHKWKHAQLQ
jgi:hypothetical protein